MERYAQAVYPAKRRMTRQGVVPERLRMKQPRSIVANSPWKAGEVQPPGAHSQAQDGCSTSGSAYHGHAMRRGVCTLALRQIWVRGGFGLRERGTPIVIVTDVSESTWPRSVMRHDDSKRMRSKVRVPAGKRV